MKVHTASLISGILFIIIGVFFWFRFDASNKWFSLADGLIINGLAIITISLLIRIGK